MKITNSVRAKAKLAIAERMVELPWHEVDLLLEEFGGSTSEYWDGTKEQYILSMLKNVAGEAILELADHLDLNLSSAKPDDMPKFWNNAEYRIFLSHLSVHKLFASELQTWFGHLGIQAFVAHEDIEPTAEWQLEIERALRTCDALVALLHDGFKASDWTDQEVGFALGRGIPVISVRLGQDPYGLFGKRQAISGYKKSARILAAEIFDSIRSNNLSDSRIADLVLGLFERSPSFDAAKQRMTWLEEMQVWNSEFSKRVVSARANNNQIRAAWGLDVRIDGLLARHSVDPQATSAFNVIEDETPF